MRLFFDFEFTGLRQFTTPISLGIVTEDTDGFYAEFTDYNQRHIDEWLQTNVIDHLLFDDKEVGYKGRFKFKHSGKPLNITGVKGNQAFVMTELKNWLRLQLAETYNKRRRQQIKFVGDVLAYDWVLLMELFGGALKIPEYINYIPIDIATMFAVARINPDINREEFAGCEQKFKHNALWDSYVIRECYNDLKDLDLMK